jgi:small subunit ribosomal protein S3
MGNKTNSTGMRLGINQPWKSVWYSPKADYADTFLQDDKVRKLIETKLKSANVGSTTIKRAMGHIEVEIRVARPGVVIGKGGEGIERLEKELKALTKTDAKVKVFEIKKPEIVAKLIAENVASQCERRISPKRAAQRAAEAAMETGLIEGVTIIVGGRIRGAEIARREEVKLGNVPKHTLRANIDYATAKAQVPSLGIHGVKVWVNKGEKHTYDIE